MVIIAGNQERVREARLTLQTEKSSVFARTTWHRRCAVYSQKVSEGEEIVTRNVV